MIRLISALPGAPLVAALAALSVSNLAIAQSEPDCRAIAAATVSELRAGYAEWNDAAEQLARAAAGAACVKARSAAPVNAAADPERLSSTPVRGAADANTGSVATATATAEATTAQDETADEKKSDEDKEAWNPFAELKFNKVSASPSKKPYERRRSAENEDD